MHIENDDGALMLRIEKQPGIFASMEGIRSIRLSLINLDELDVAKSCTVIGSGCMLQGVWPKFDDRGSWHGRSWSVLFRAQTGLLRL